LGIGDASNPRKQTIQFLRKGSSAGKVAKANISSWAKDAAKFASGGGFVWESAEGAFAQYGIEGRVRKMQTLGIAELEVHQACKSFHGRKLVGLRHALSAEIDTYNVAREALGQKESAGTCAARDI
jgi:hypothetical protein